MAKEPKRLGRYDIERLLGEGGMGRVWLARDTVLGRRVAIKTLRDDLALPPRVREELVQRMRHEARAAASVSHPNIVTLHDMGEDPKFGLYLVFEYVPGPSNPDAPQSLRERLREGTLTLEELAKLARELGAALTFAHEAGVVHRDVKPENVLFSRTGAKIADFGIARIPESTITRANTVLGTPAYTAPEALSFGDFSPLSDQFSLAATLYEAASGTRAFAGEDAIATAGKVSSEPPPPLEQKLGESATVRAIDAVLARGLAKDPKARYGSCIGLGEAVARAIEPAGLGSALRMNERLSVPPQPMERTPLSSRVARERISQPPPAPGEVPPALPSVYIRKRTQRSQNIAAGIALLVILGLVVFGRKEDEARRERAREAAAASASAAAAASAARHAPPPKTAKPADKAPVQIRAALPPTTPAPASEEDAGP